MTRGKRRARSGDRAQRGPHSGDRAKLGTHPAGRESADLFMDRSANRYYNECMVRAQRVTKYSLGTRMKSDY